MLYWVIYDISSNSTRLRISEKCKDYGLQRVQKSAFLGNVSKNKLDMLAMKVRDILAAAKEAKRETDKTSPDDANDTVNIPDAMSQGQETGENDAVFIFPSCKLCFGERRIEGAFDEEAVRKKDFLIISGA